MLIKTTHAPRWARAAMLFIPALWLGLILGISFLEAPLKFTAPGITIPLGSGSGGAFSRDEAYAEVARVFHARRTVHAVAQPPVSRAAEFQPDAPWGLVALVLLLVKTAVIRPLLAVHSDRCWRALFEGGSTTHYYYIGVEVLLVVALVALMVVAMRGLLPPTADVAGVVPHEKTAADE